MKDLHLNYKNSTLRFFISQEKKKKAYSNVSYSQNQMISVKIFGEDIQKGYKIDVDDATEIIQWLTEVYSLKETEKCAYCGSKSKQMKCNHPEIGIDDKCLSCGYMIKKKGKESVI